MPLASHSVVRLIILLVMLLLQYAIRLDLMSSLFVKKGKKLTKQHSARQEDFGAEKQSTDLK